MRTFALASIVALTTFSFNASASTIDTALVGICDSVAQDNKSRFRKKLKESNLKLRNVYSGISCGGEPLVRFAMKKGADQTGSFIVKRMPQSHFKASGDLEWAKSNGFADSAIVSAIASR